VIGHGRVDVERGREAVVDLEPAARERGRVVLPVPPPPAPPFWLPPGPPPEPPPPWPPPVDEVVLVVPPPSPPTAPVPDDAEALPLDALDDDVPSKRVTSPKTVQPPTKSAAPTRLV
jgi:hypothetical protein